MTKTYEGQLEIDHSRGVIYFHCSDPEVCEKFRTVSILRICSLPKPIPEAWIDITHMHGVHFGEHERENQATGSGIENSP